MRRLSPRERKLVAVGLLVLVLATAWIGIVAPIMGGFSKRAQERELLLAAYQRNQRVLGGINVWRADIARQRQNEGRFTILAPTEALAADLLKQRIARAFQTTGAEVRGVQDQQADARKGWVRVRADLRLTQDQLTAGLVRLENEEPYVVVDYFAVAAERAFETGRSGPVDVRIDVSARARPGAVQPLEPR
ncbi:MAG: type II secretion system protein GspM [Caulobacteraceae bacterium]